MQVVSGVWALSKKGVCVAKDVCVVMVKLFDYSTVTFKACVLSDLSICDVSRNRIFQI